jgi:hypothetical protein
MSDDASPLAIGALAAQADLVAEADATDGQRHFRRQLA